MGDLAPRCVQKSYRRQTHPYTHRYTQVHVHVHAHAYTSPKGKFRCSGPVTEGVRRRLHSLSPATDLYRARPPSPQCDTHGRTPPQTHSNIDKTGTLRAHSDARTHTRSGPAVARRHKADCVRHGRVLVPSSREKMEMNSCHANQ